MPHTQSRVVGSGFTTFNYRGQRIAFLDSIADTGQQPVSERGTPWEAVIPLDQLHAVEIATSRALQPGTLTASIRELWNAPVWNQLAGLAGTNDILDVYGALAADPAQVTCQMLIKAPGAASWRGKNYHNCIVSTIEDGENVTIGAITVSKSVTIIYTHTTPFVLAAG